MASAMADEVPTPTSIAEVEALILRLYDPGNPPELIPRIQTKLIEVQKSAEGWQLADTLMNSDDVKVRFFGCLTFTVKLNSDWESLDEDTSLVVLEKLVSWFVRLVAADEQPMVLQKLCATLVTYFLKPSAQWKHCIRHLVASLAQGAYVKEDEASLDGHGTVSELLPRLNAKQLVATLWFSKYLAEEGRKADSKSIRQAKILQRMESNLIDSADVIEFAFSNTTSPPLPSGGSARDIPAQDLTILEAAFHCWSQWDYYAHNFGEQGATNVKRLQSLTDYALQCCFITDNPFGDEATNSMIDLMIICGIFFERPQLKSVSEMIRGPWGQQRGAEPEDPNFLTFGRFVLAFGDAALQDLVEVNDAETEELMRLIHELNKTPGLAVEDDEVVIFAVEFWVSYAEYAMDSAQIAGPTKTQATPETTRVRKHLLDAMIEFWHKIRCPPPEVVEEWTPDDKTTFSSFRNDVKDLYLTSYETIGEELLKSFGTMLEESLNHQSWWHLEASMFALSGFSDVMDEDHAGHEIIARIFGSSLFSELVAAGDAVPSRVQRSAVDFLGSFSSFFEDHLDLLPSALNFLFATLKTPSLTNSAARSIVSMCSSCRTELTSELESFFTKYEEVLSWPSVDIPTKRSLIGAISAIAQTIEDDQEKLAATNRILGFIAQDVEASLRLMAAGDTDPARDAGMAALSCLANMAEKFQAPDEAVVDLESDINSPNFWNSGQGHAVQLRVVSYIEQIYSILSNDGEVYDRGFEVLRAGFAETVPGPFVFPNHVAIDVFRQSNIENPRVHIALQAMAALLKARSDSLKEQEAQRLLEHVFRLMTDLGSPSEDPEISQALIDVLERFAKNHLTVLLQHQSVVQQLFDFTLLALKGDDLFPRRSAAAFWRTFILLSRSTPEAGGVFTHYGPQVTEILMVYIGGDAARSELKVICDPLRALLKSDPRSREWIEAALLSSSFPSTRVGAEQKRQFALAIFMTRGDSKTVQVATDFWSECRGTVQSYN